MSVLPESLIGRVVEDKSCIGKTGKIEGMCLSVLLVIESKIYNYCPSYCLTSCKQLPY